MIDRLDRPPQYQHKHYLLLHQFKNFLKIFSCFFESSSTSQPRERKQQKKYFGIFSQNNSEFVVYIIYFNMCEIEFVSLLQNNKVKKYYGNQ